MSDRGWEPVTLVPLGQVESDFTLSDSPEYSREAYHRESTVVIDPELEPALTGIEGFSHLIVLYYQHRKDEWQERVGWGKRGERILGLPTGPDGSGFRGILTTRAPARPSGIGLAVVELIERRGNRLRVKGLDAIDGSPVLDVRGYML
ncbi:MAG: TrmO family methyltransferase, partial [Clostridia bacterium]|nr:TrmO family methyltransferase [Clostridia bacterium]